VVVSGYRLYRWFHAVLLAVVQQSVEAAATQVVGNNDIGDSVKHKLDVVRVGRTCLVAVDFLRRALVLCLKLCLDVCRRFFIGLFACLPAVSNSINMFLSSCKYKKFELMLTRRAKAYSSSGSR